MLLTFDFTITVRSPSATECVLQQDKGNGFHCCSSYNKHKLINHNLFTEIQEKLLCFMYLCFPSVVNPLPFLSKKNIILQLFLYLHLQRLALTLLSVTTSLIFWHISKSSIIIRYYFTATAHTNHVVYILSTETSTTSDKEPDITL